MPSAAGLGLTNHVGDESPSGQTTAVEFPRGPGHRASGLSTALILIVAYVILWLGLMVSNGFYSHNALLMLLASFSLVVVAFATAVRGGKFDERTTGTPVFAIALILLLLSAETKAAGLGLNTPRFNQLYHIVVLVLAVVAAVAYLVFRRSGHRLRRVVFTFAVIAAIAFRIWMPIVSPHARNDVLAMGQMSSQALLQGKNPFSTHTSSYPGYVYLPADLYIQTISYRLAGDVRYASVLAEIVIAFALWRLARRRWSEATAQLMALLFLYAPRGLYVIEFAWLDPLILMLFALFLLLRDRDKPMLAAVAYGYMLVMKQYMVFAFFQWFIIERNWKRIATGLVVAAVTLIPFVVADWHSFLRMGVLYNVVQPFRKDALSVFSLLARRWGLTPPPGWAILVGAVLTIATFLPQGRIKPIRGYLFAVTITMFGMFLFGSLAFINWYYLVAGQLIFLLVVGGKPDDLRADVIPAAEAG